LPFLTFFKIFTDFFIQEISNIQSFEHEVIWRTLIRTKWHQVSLPSLQLAKVMAISNFEISVLHNFCSKNLIEIWLKLPIFGSLIFNQTSFRPIFNHNYNGSVVNMFSNLFLSFIMDNWTIFHICQHIFHWNNRRKHMVGFTFRLLFLFIFRLPIGCRSE
jgi:hypothetical protein